MAFHTVSQTIPPLKLNRDPGPVIIGILSL